MKKIIFFVLAVMFVAACNDPFEDNITPAYEQYPVSTYLEMDTIFTQWVRLLVHADLYNTLNLSKNYTCFVPNDDAMQRYLDSKPNYSSVEDIPFEEAQYLVKYHTIAGSEYVQSLFDNGVLPDTTATGDFLSIEIREGGLNSIYVNGEARISQLDIDATNGVIHVLDDVLTPVTETIWQKMSADGYSIMKEAIEVTGYSELLNTTSVYEKNSETGRLIQRKYYYTLFATTDEVFQKNNITSVADLAAFLGASDLNYKDPSNALNVFVGYQILSKQYDYTTLTTFNEDVTSRNLSTVSANELINISDREGLLCLNYNDETGSYISITDANNSTKNGMIHTIDSVMVTIIPPITTVAWDIADYTDLAATIPTYYRNTNSSTTMVRLSPGNYTSLNWAAIPSSANDRAVAYVIANKNEDVLSGLVNSDCLYLDLGLYGWIEMQSPTIIQGTYDMKVTYYSIATTSKFGSFNSILDGVDMGKEIVTHGASSTAPQIVTTLIGRVTFDESSQHTLRILATDDRAVYIDQIVFEPVN